MEQSKEIILSRIADIQELNNIKGLANRAVERQLRYEAVIKQSK